jgi:Protein of unknown function (DUF3035)
VQEREIMRKLVIGTAALTLSIALSGCGSSGLYDRDRPDEFAVTRAAPLAVPKDFTLAAPTPGAPRPQETGTKEQVLDALFGSPPPR